MPKVIGGMTMSLDGFINDKSGDVSRLYPDLAELRHTEMLQESIRTTGAVVMGRRAYDMAQGDFTGYEYQVPIFVLTHRAPQTVAKGENGAFKFHFVSEGIEAAVSRAKAAAGARNVTVIGGAQTIRACIKASLLDEIEIGIMPVLLGDGLRLFETLGIEPVELKKIKVVETGPRTDIVFRLSKR